MKGQKKVPNGKCHNTRQVGKPGIRLEDVVLRDTTQILEYEDGGDERKTEKNGGVFLGRPGPRKGSSATDRWMDVLLLAMFSFVSQIRMFKF